MRQVREIEEKAIQNTLNRIIEKINFVSNFMGIKNKLATIDENFDIKDESSWNVIVDCILVASVLWDKDENKISYELSYIKSYRGSFYEPPSEDYICINSSIDNIDKLVIMTMNEWSKRTIDLSIQELQMIENNG